MHTGMNGHSRLYVLSGSNLLAVKAFRARAEGQYSLCSGLGEEAVNMTNASNGTFLNPNADHEAAWLQLRLISAIFQLYVSQLSVFLGREHQYRKLRNWLGPFVPRLETL